MDENPPAKPEGASVRRSLCDARARRLVYNRHRNFVMNKVLVCLAAFLAAAAPAQQSSGSPANPQPPAAQQPPAAPPENQAEPGGSPIRVEVNEVIVPVTVTDEKGRFVSNLEKKDFEILDEGKPQNITFFSRERSQPVVSGFLIDLSNSSRAQWKNFQTAATELVLTLLPGKEKFSGYLIGYGNKAELMVNTTTDPEPIISKIRELKPGGGAALYDAIYMACTNRALVPGEPFEPRRVLIVIGDGNDNASSKTLDQVIEVAQKNLVTIYAISTVSYGFTSSGTANLTRLAEETGGRVEYPLQNVYKDVQGFQSTPSDEGNFAFKVGTGGFASALASAIFKSVANVAGEVTTQYILRYIPNDDDPKKTFRELNVKVALPDVKVRARKGYYPVGR
jgi:Ca-activated chloride channel family protein